MAEAVDDAALEETLTPGGGASLEQTIKKLTRSSNRLTWALIVLVLVITGAAGFEIVMLRDRLETLEGGVTSRVNRAHDDYARIQDQTSAVRGGIELLHKELGQLRRQVDEVNRHLRQSER